MNPTLRRILMAMLGIALGGLCLWLTARSLDWAEAARILASADIAGIALGVALHGCAMIMRAQRWRAIIAFRAPIGLGQCLQALLTGFAVNASLPARLGELFRADYMARRTGVSRSAVLASIFVERLLDLIAVVGLLGIGLALAGGGDATSRGVLIAGAVLTLTGAGVLVLIMRRVSQQNAHAVLSAMIARLPGGAALASRLGAMLGDFSQLLNVMRTARFAIAAATTVPIWAVETTALWLICRSVGVDLGPAAMLSLMGGANLSTLLPTAPGYVGSYQLSYVLILGQFGVGATAAIVAATTAQVHLIGVFALIGFAVLGIGSLRAIGLPARKPPVSHP